MDDLDTAKIALKLALPASASVASEREVFDTQVRPQADGNSPTNNNRPGRPEK
jgi:hypothetical protein